MKIPLPTRQRIDDLLGRLQAGDRQAFDPLFAELWPHVRAFASHVLGGSADAQDAAEDALLKVFERVNQYDSTRDGVAWVFTIVVYECRTYRTRARRRREVSSEEAGLVAFESSGPTAEDLTIARDLERALEDVLSKLRPEDIETLRSAVYGTRPDMPGATFRKRLERAIDRLRVAWSKTHEK